MLFVSRSFRIAKLIIVVLCKSALFSTSALGSLIIDSVEGQRWEADGYTSFTTSSAEMVGMRVTVEFRNGNVETALWDTNGINEANWSITQGPGSTFSNPFLLENSSRSRIMRLTLHGGNATTIFDRGVNPSTDGTANGRDFVEVSNFSETQDVTVNYFDAVQTTGATPVMDIYAGLSINFSIGIRRRDFGFQFIVDTDSTINLLRPVSSSVPEVSTSVMTMIGVVFAWLPRRRRVKRQSC